MTCLLMSIFPFTQAYYIILRSTIIPISERRKMQHKEVSKPICSHKLQRIQTPVIPRFCDTRGKKTFGLMVAKAFQFCVSNNQKSVLRELSGPNLCNHQGKKMFYADIVKSTSLRLLTSLASLNSLCILIYAMLIKRSQQS